MNPVCLRIPIAVAVLLTVCLITACEETPSPGDSATENPSTELPQLSLNDGEKWQTDDHTRGSVGRMQDLIETTPPEELGSALAGEISFLFEGCTMEGPAHDQLHVFLADLLGHVNGLYSSTTAEERNPEVAAIRRLFEDYHRFFE